MSDWRNTVPQIVNKIKQYLHASKADHVNHLDKWILNYDPQNTGYMTKHDFELFLKKIGIFLTTQEFRCLFDNYAVQSQENPNKLVNYSEILDNIKVDMSEYRLSLVKSAFQFLDTKNQGKIPIQELFEKYQANEHPRARTNMKPVELIRQEFQLAITAKSQDQINITEQEFLSYYSDLNLTHSNEKDEYFADLIIRTWGMTSGKNYVSPQRIADLEIILYEKIRQKTFTKKDEGQTAYGTFRHYDFGDTKFLDYNQFQKAIISFGCTFSDKEVQALFFKYADQETQKINYAEFSQLFANIGSGRYANNNTVFDELKKPPTLVLNTVKEFLASRQISNEQLQQAFQRLDVYSQGYLDREGFQQVLQKQGLYLGKQENDKLYRFFDPNYNDQIDYLAFLQQL